MKKFILPLIAALLLTGCGKAGSSPASSPVQDAAASPSGSAASELAHKNGWTYLGFSDSGLRASGPEASSVDTEQDIVYYPDGQDFTFGEGTEDDAHPAAEAAAHTVYTVTKPGTYVLEGEILRGQVAVDLGEDAGDDPEAVVTLVLCGLDLSCTVAPAVIFYNVYECGGETAPEDLDLSAAGARVVIADGTENNISGSYVAKIYKSVTLSDDGKTVVDSKKLHKYDGAFYSKMSMTVSGGELGDGVLNINAENEGMDSELHLGVMGGNINIVSGNDGINTNEDGVSVCAVYGGSVSIRISGESGEGDGIDSNGYILVDGGGVSCWSCSDSGDAGLDSDCGVIIKSGFVTAAGNMYSELESETQPVAVFSFSERQSGGKTAEIRDSSGEAVCSCTPENAFSYVLFSSPELLEGAEYSLFIDGEAVSAVSQAQAGAFPAPGGGTGSTRIALNKGLNFFSAA